MTPSHRPFAALTGTVLALVLTCGAAAAHQGEDRPPERAAAAAAADAAKGHGQMADGHMSAADMQVTDMTCPTGDDGGMMMDHHGDRPTTFGGRLLAWLGMWHPAIIHFPIALLLTVGFLEAAAAIRKNPGLAAGNGMLLGLAAISAVIAAPMGWANAGLPEAGDSLALDIHRWLGTALPLLIIAVWSLRASRARTGRPAGPLYQGLLAASVTLILVQAYFGAEMTHGASHMAF